MLIGINGIKGSGKDYFGKVMLDLLGNDSHQILKFADPIRQTVESIYGEMTEVQFDDFKRIDHPNQITGKWIPGREIVRGIGMKMRSYDGGQQFLDHVTDGHASIPGTTFVTDLRFENEFGLPWDYTIKVESDDAKSDGAESEQVWPDGMFNFIIRNKKEGPEVARAVSALILMCMGYDVPNHGEILYHQIGDKFLLDGYETEIICNWNK